MDAPTMTMAHAEAIEALGNPKENGLQREVIANIEAQASKRGVYAPTEEIERVRDLADQVFQNGKWANGGLILDIANRWLGTATTEPT